MGLPLADQDRGSVAYRCNWVVIKMLEISASGVLLLDLDRLLDWWRGGEQGGDDCHHAPERYMNSDLFADVRDECSATTF